MNVKDRTFIDASNVAALQSVIDNVPYFNPASPGTFTMVDLNTGTYARDVEFNSSMSMLYVTNNYNIPVRVEILLCMPRVDTSITGATALTDGLADVGSGLTGTTPLISVRDSPLFNQLWMVKKTKKRTLFGGQSMSLKNFVGKFVYQPALEDSHAQTYQPRWGAHAYFLSIEGVLSHATATPTDIGFAGAGVDWCLTRKFVVSYDGGVEVKWIEVSQTVGAMATAVVSARPDVVKESYSVS